MKKVVTSKSPVVQPPCKKKRFFFSYMKKDVTSKSPVVQPPPPHTHAHTRTHTHAHMHVCIYVRMYTYTCTTPNIYLTPILHTYTSRPYAYYVGSPI